MEYMFQSAYKSKSVKRVKLKGLDFVLINSMAFHQDGCFLCRDAEQILDKVVKVPAFVALS